MVGGAVGTSLWMRSGSAQRGGEEAEIELAVVGHHPPQELWRLAGLPVDLGERADLREVRRKLEGLPVVESVEVQGSVARGTVRMLVRERKPLAVLICPAAGVGTPGSEVSMVLDRWGVAVPMGSYAGVAGAMERLPKVQVLKIEGFAPGVRLKAAAVQAAVAILAESEKASGLGKVAGVRQLNDYSIIVDFEGDLTVQFPFEDPGGQMQKLRLMQSDAERQNRRLKTVNLVLRRNIPATFAAETAEEFPGRDVQRETVRK